MYKNKHSWLFNVVLDDGEILSKLKNKTGMKFGDWTAVRPRCRKYKGSHVIKWEWVNSKGETRLSSSLKQQIKDRRNQYFNVKFKVMTHYCKGDPCCQWPGCTISDMRCLSIDHINNDGAEFKRKMHGKGTGGYLYRFLLKNNFPKDVQVLCMNHQMIKAYEANKFRIPL